MKHPSIVIALLTAVTATATKADVITFQDGLNGYNGTESTYIEALGGSGQGTNFGSETTLILGGSSNYAFVRFSDLIGSNAISAGSNINSASIVLTVDQQTGGSDPHSVQSYSVFDPVKNWNETTVTYNSFANGTFTSTGADCSVTTCSMGDVINQSTLISSFTPASPLTFITIDVTSLAQEWIDTPSDNFGLLIGDIDGNNGDYAAFHSDDSTFANLRPFLQVDFTAANPVPTPGSLALFGLGLLVLIKGRRAKTVQRTLDG